MHYLKGIGPISIKDGLKISEKIKNVFLEITIYIYATVPYFEIRCQFSSSVDDVTMVTLQSSYFFDILHFLVNFDIFRQNF